MKQEKVTEIKTQIEIGDTDIAIIKITHKMFMMITFKKIGKKQRISLENWNLFLNLKIPKEKPKTENTINEIKLTERSFSGKIFRWKPNQKKRSAFQRVQ